MKKLINIYFFGLIFLIISCKSRTQSQDVSILLDQTEDYFIYPTLDELREISILTKSDKNSELIRLKTINETGFNIFSEISIPAVTSEFFNNDFKRKAELKNYFLDINEGIEDFNLRKKEAKGSFIYKVIVEELIRLSASGANYKKLIIVSDCMENSSLSNFYNSDIFIQLSQDPNRLMEKFQKMYPLPNMSDIEVILIYQPRNRLEGEKFEIVSNFYKQLFKEHGCTLNAMSNL